MEIITRLEAAKRGLKYFNTGRPCSFGHLSDRYTSTGHCCECVKENNKKYSQKIKQMLDEARGVTA